MLNPSSHVPKMPGTSSAPSPASAGRATHPAAAAAQHGLESRGGIPPAQVRTRIPLPRISRTAQDADYIEVAIAAMRPPLATLDLPDIMDRSWHLGRKDPQRIVEALTVGQRTQLARELENRMRVLPEQHALEATWMWLTVQRARLNRRESGGMQMGTGYAASVLILRQRSSVDPRHPEYVRPEYHDAINSLLRLIGDATLRPILREQLTNGLTQYWLSERGLTASDEMAFRDRGVQALSDQGYRSGPPAALREESHLFSLNDATDIGMQRRSLDEEVRELMARVGDQLPPNWRESFNEEPQARSFARVMARVAGTSNCHTAPEVICAIAQDAELRGQVFAMSVTALGSCGDNVAEGWSQIVTQVRNHQVAQRVVRGEIKEPELHVWGRRQFRLATLEALVHEAMAQWRQDPNLSGIQAAALAREPLETMLHAKSALKAELDLPAEVPSSMAHRRCSVLDPSTLRLLADEVRCQEADPARLFDFLLANDTWKAGMKRLHEADFEALRLQFEEDPFYDLPVPADGDANVEEQTAYAEMAFDLECRIDDAARDLLRRLHQQFSNSLLSGSSAGHRNASQ